MAPGKAQKGLGAHAFRVLNLIDSQVRSLRKRQLITAFESKLRRGAYWSTWTEIGEYHVELPLSCPPERTRELAAIPTRLKRLSDEHQARLINWGMPSVTRVCALT